MQSQIETRKSSGKRGRPPTRRPRQHKDLLDAVARKINVDGAGAVTLSEIREFVGLSRSSLYYYCSDAADLVHQAYLSACRQLADDLTLATRSPEREDAQIEAFVRQVLRLDHAPIAALNDLAFLPKTLQEDVRAASGELMDHLEAVIAAGQARGVIRDEVDARMCARLILNILSWALVSLPWLNRRDEDAGVRVQYVEAVCDILLNGVAKGTTAYIPCTLRYEDLMTRKIDAFDRSQTAELKAEQIISTASRLFNLKGLDGVRLDEISAEIGVSNGAIYHHFKDKADLIESCYNRAFEIYELIMTTGMTASESPLERAATVTHLNAQAQLDQNAPLALQPGFGKLSDAKRVEFNRRAIKLGEISGDTLSQGIVDGSCREIDTRFAPEILAGYFLGLSRWSETQGLPIASADVVTDIAIYGLRPRG